MIETVRDHLAEAFAAVLRRPARAALTALGTILGAGALVATLGLTATIQAQITDRFDELKATQVVVSDPAAVDHPTNDRTAVAAAEQRLSGLNGVRAAGLAETSKDPLPVAALPGTADGQSASVIGVTPGFLAAAGATVTDGRPPAAYDNDAALPVAWIGRAAAQSLEINLADPQPLLYVDGLPVLVAGVIADPGADPDLLLAVVLPRSTAHRLPDFRPNTAQWTLRTRLGAAVQVGAEAPLALNPEAPDTVTALVPPDPASLRASVEDDVRNLYLLLAGLTLIVGAVGISNSALVSVIERTGEIGLRRALGATRRAIIAQFLTESAMIGLFGGIIGAALAVDVITIVAEIKDWTVVMDPTPALLAPVLAAAVGLLAGAYPARRAARILPVHALRQH